MLADTKPSPCASSKVHARTFPNISQLLMQSSEIASNMLDQSAGWSSQLWNNAASKRKGESGATKDEMKGMVRSEYNPNLNPIWWAPM